MPLPPKMEYRAGTYTSVRIVENVKPNTTTMPNGCHISEPEPRGIAIGIIPRTAVQVVIKMGRRRLLPAWIIALSTDIPRSRFRLA
jgi:hypothetical protein